MGNHDHRAVVLGTALLLAPLVTGGVLLGERGAEQSKPTDREGLVQFAFDQGEKAELKGPHVVIYHREFLTRLTTDRRPARNVPPPSQNILRFSIWDRGPKMTSPADFGMGKDALFIELYDPKARKAVLPFATRLAPSPRVDRMLFVRNDMVYTMCWDIGFDGFNNDYDQYVDQHNILQRKRPVDYPVSVGELKGTFNQKMRTQGEQLCEVLVKEVYEAIAEGRTVELGDSPD